MAWNNSATRYGSAMITMHWLMLLLLAAVYALMELREFYPSGSAPRELMKAWHYTVGLGVFVLTGIRLGIRLGQPMPLIEPALVRWQHLLSKAVHGALYLLLLVMPVLGWLALSAEGETSLVNGLDLPALIGTDKAAAEVLHEAHEIIGSLGYVLIGLHAAAALYHHYFLRDNTLTRMLPSKQ